MDQTCRKFIVILHLFRRDFQIHLIKYYISSMRNIFTKVLHNVDLSLTCVVPQTMNIIKIKTLSTKKIPFNLKLLCLSLLFTLELYSNNIKLSCKTFLIRIVKFSKWNFKWVKCLQTHRPLVVIDECLDRYNIYT